VIASGHFGAKALLARSEFEIHLLLDQVYGREGWRHFETESSDHSIDVYGVVPSHAAAEHLLREAGFSLVRQHLHDYAEFRHCRCEWSWLAEESELLQ
jgi:hypothetical protein